MADAHEAADYLTRTDTRIAPPALEVEDSFNPLDISFQQRHHDDFPTQYRKATGTDALHSEVEQAAIGISQGSIVPKDPNITVEDIFTPSQVNRSSSSITNTMYSVESRHDEMQDERSDSYSHLHLINQDLNCDTRPVKSALGTKDEFHPGRECPTRRDFFTSRFTWLNGTIIFICSVSTALSAVFVFLALKGQRYRDSIGNDPEAKMSISTAILWTSIVAKTIELSFVTGFVAFLGQVLSRRAFVDSNSRGVTLSELTMWRWVVQPGSLVTQSEIAKYAGLSSLGILTLLSTILSTLYVTAATALVQPIPKQGDWHSKIMVGSVKTDFANINYITSLCQIPIPDKLFAGATCLQIEYAGKSYYNLAKFLANWDDMVKTNNGTSIDQEQRPTWIGLPYANTTVVPQWINIVNTTEVSRKYQRVVNNVSLAMPHIGVSNAVRDQRNVMPQSETSNAVKAYSLWASVPSPIMKVLCIHMNEKELAPIVYDAWNSEEVNATSWPALQKNATTTNKTVVDDLFGWTKEDNVTMVDYPPVFARYPKPFNTILNHTSLTWGRTAMYLLGQGGLMDDGTDLTGQYPLCKLEVDISPRCSTVHSVSVSGSKVEALCEDRAADMAYVKTKTNATTIQGVENWRDIGFDWANSLSLNTGIMDANSSHPRILMMLQLAPGSSDVKLNHLLPSLAETLAVTASDTLLAAWQDAPFVDHWNYTVPLLETSQTQWFKAKIKSQEYASGGVDNASKGWLVILISTLFLNVLMLVYFILQPGLVTDFSQPPQLFALAVNSPPTRALAGSCGGGPEGKQYKVGWAISHERGHIYIEPTSEEQAALVTDESDPNRIADPQTRNSEAPIGSGLLSTISAVFGSIKLNLTSRTKVPTKISPASGTEPLRPPSTTESIPSLQSQYELGEMDTRTQQQYTRLSQNRSIF